MTLRPLLTSIFLISICAQTALAQQRAMTIRAGEHPNYSRLVIPGTNDLAWEFRTFGREATLMLPTSSITYDTSRIFDRIPRARILKTTAEVVGDETYITLVLGCDCNVSTAIEGGGLIIDVRDSAPSPADATTVEAGATDTTPPQNTAQEVVERPISRPAVGANAPPEPTDQPSAPSGIPNDLADLLIAQLNKAAEQGIVELNDQEEPPAPSQAPMQAAEPQDPTPPQPDDTGLTPRFEAIDGLDGVAERMQQALDDVAGASDLGGSVRITIPEELAQPPKRQNNGRRPPADKVVADTDPDLQCVDDELLDVGYWADERSYSVQVADLQSRVFGEFDEPNLGAVLELARFFIFFGLGTEAKSLLDDLKLEEFQSDLLMEIANTVEGKPHFDGGILDSAANCTGAVAMWRTAALDTTETQPLPDADEVIATFSELPIEVRRIIGPRLVKSFLARDQRTEASQIFAIVERAAGNHGDEHELMRAELALLNGDHGAAEQIYWTLVYENSASSGIAATALVTSMLDRDAQIPANVLSVLEALAFEYRGSELGKDLLLTAIKAKAGTNELADAIKTALAEIEASPDMSQAYFNAVDDILADASLSETGDVAYLSVIFDNWQIVESEVLRDETKIKVAQEVMGAGLANTARDVLATLSDANEIEVRPILAEAAMRLNDRATVINLQTALPDDQLLRALASRALGGLGQHEEALTVATGVDDLPGTASLAWRAGVWDAVDDTTDLPVKLLSQFMRARNDAESTKPSLDPDTAVDYSVPEIAVTTAIPKQDDITLKLAEDLRLQSSTLRQFLSTTIAGM